MIRGSSWECGWCGDFGSLQRTPKKKVTEYGTDHVDPLLRLSRRSTRNVERFEKGAGAACAQEHRAFSASRKSAAVPYLSRNPARRSFAGREKGGGTADIST